MPRIEDVFRILEILESMGVKVEWIGERTVAITPGDFDPARADQEKVKRLRSSILLLGSLAAPDMALVKRQRKHLPYQVIRQPSLDAAALWQTHLYR